MLQTLETKHNAHIRGAVVNLQLKGLHSSDIFAASTGVSHVTSSIRAVAALGPFTLIFFTQNIEVFLQMYLYLKNDALLLCMYTR
jgi:hypothetical protein